MKKILILLLLANILFSSPFHVKDGLYRCVGFAVTDKNWKLIYKLNEAEMKKSIITLDKKNNELIDSSGVVFKFVKKFNQNLIYKSNSNTTIMIRNKDYKNKLIGIGISFNNTDKNALYLCSTKPN